jgi:tetratricopeptide (TPR) repeat protein
MVVLFIVGFTVEIILGWRMYAIAYVIGGLAAVGFYWLIHPESQGMLGASGAISGVMGIYAALFGLRKINFFYFVFFYMGVFMAPALLILAVWLLNELIQFFAAPESRVAYMAHFGGLLGGAIIGFSNRYLNRSINLDYIEKPEQQKQYAADFERGVELMRNMKFEAAKRIFKQLLKEQPTSLEVLSHLYTVSKTTPDSEDYHQSAATIFKICIDSNKGHSLANQVFNDYIRQAKPAPRLNALICLKLASRFAKAGFMDTVEKIIRILMPKATKLPDLASLLSQTAYAFEQQQNQDKASHYYQMVLKYFPDSNEANHLVKANKV